jgi:raffinose/stachyose/melibiose transport system permease protein
MKKSNPGRILISAITVFTALFWAAISLLPFYLMIMTSFKSSPDYGKNGFFAFPQRFMYQNYVRVVKDGIFNYFRNSIIVVAIALSLLLVVSLCASYPLSRFTYRLRKPMNSFIVASMSIPMHVTHIPVYLLTRAMGIYDTLQGLIIP